MIMSECLDDNPDDVRRDAAEIISKGVEES
jgi:hypothetical protein